MDTNSCEKFGQALDHYEKALAKRDYKSACDYLEEAIGCNPFPSLYNHLAVSLAQVREAHELEIEAMRPKGFLARLNTAFQSPHKRQSTSLDNYGRLA